MAPVLRQIFPEDRPSEIEVMVDRCMMSQDGNPPTESIVIGPISEASQSHRVPSNRYILFFELSLAWKPYRHKDPRNNRPDLAIGRYAAGPQKIQLLGGFEVKRPVQVMMDPEENLATVGSHPEVASAFRTLYDQAEDQAKSAMKCGMLPRNATVYWLGFVGPWFCILKFGRFRDGQLKTRALKSESSEDSIEMDLILQRTALPPADTPLYKLGTYEGGIKFEEFITLTKANYPDWDTTVPLSPMTGAGIPQDENHHIARQVAVAQDGIEQPLENLGSGYVMDFLTGGPRRQDRFRFLVIPQCRLPWNPDDDSDRRLSIADIVLGRYVNVAPYLLLRGGAEMKRPVWPLMQDGPAILNAGHDDIEDVFKKLYEQAEDQVKSAIKCNMLPPNKNIYWLIFIGPYIGRLTFKPFTPEELDTSAVRKNESGEHRITELYKKRVLPAKKTQLYRLGTPKAAAYFEEYLTLTEGYDDPARLMNA